jgi:glycosyltransferase involved in cell wall biosynthesis
MKIVHIIYAGMGGHGDVVFPKIERDIENKYFLLFIGIEGIFSNYIKTCKRLNIKYYFIDYKKKITFYIKLIQILNLIRPKIIFLHTGHIFSLLSYKFFNYHVKLISFQHVSLNIKNIKNYIYDFFEFIFFDKVVFLTSTYRNKVCKKYKFISLAKKSTIISTGLNNFKVDLNKKTIDRKKINIGMSTRFVKGKKILNLIHLIKYNYETLKLPLFLSIIGMGVDYRNIKMIINKFNLEKYIKLKSIVSENEMNKWNLDLSIYLHFSDGETASTSIIRALRAGTPVIASNVTGIKEMVRRKQHINGYLVNDKNFHHILNLIKQVAYNKKLYKELSKNSLYIFKNNYTLKMSFINYSKLIKLYE